MLNVLTLRPTPNVQLYKILQGYANPVIQHMKTQDDAWYCSFPIVRVTSANPLQPLPEAASKVIPYIMAGRVADAIQDLEKEFSWGMGATVYRFSKSRLFIPEKIARVGKVNRVEYKKSYSLRLPQEVLDQLVLHDSF